MAKTKGFKKKAPVDTSSTKSVKRSQLLNTYSPVICAQSNRLSKLQFQLMCDTFLQNDNI